MPHHSSEISLTKVENMKKEFLAIFDLDGTLFDTVDVNYLSYKQALAVYNIPFTRQEFAEKYNGMHYSNFLPALAGGSMEIAEDIHERKKALYESNLSHARENIHLFNMIEALSDSYHIAIVSTANRKNVTRILEYFGRTSLFELIITGEDMLRVKPDPQGFYAAMEHFGVPAERTVIYEDSPIGLQAAHASGACVMAVQAF